MSISSFFPCLTALTSLSQTSLGSLVRICLTPKVLMPKYSDTGWTAGAAVPFDDAAFAFLPAMDSRTALRGVEVEMAMWLGFRGQGRRYMLAVLALGCTINCAISAPIHVQKAQF